MIWFYHALAILVALWLLLNVVFTFSLMSVAKRADEQSQNIMRELHR